MKQLYLLFSAFCIGTLCNAQSIQATQPGLAPLTKYYLAQTANKKTPADLQQEFVYKEIGGRLYISALVKVSDAAKAQQSVNAAGAYTGTKAGDIWTLQIPVEQVRSFTQASGFSYIQLDEPVFPQLDVARKTTRVDSVHAGYNLPTPFSGKNVLVGVIDFGFDYNHPTVYDTLGNKYRIRKVWELGTTGTPPTGYAYGHEITDTNLIKTQGTDNKRQTHGTDVSGMAAGSGYGSNSNARFRGMAYEADMIFVGVRRDSIGKQWMQSGFSDFIDGISYIFTNATAMGKPAVVNISWGSQSGPHDGSSLFNQACNNLSGMGRIVVMSAGNEGEKLLHLSKTFTATDTIIRSFTTFTSPNYQRTWVDVWGETGKTFCGKVTLYHNGVAGNTTAFYCLDGQTYSTYLKGANNQDTCFIDFITSPAESFNGKPRLTMSIFNKATDSVAVMVKGNSGTINLWDEYYYYGYTYGYSSSFQSLGQPNFAGGDNVSSTSDMGSAQSVLLVGAYASKIQFTNINGQTLGYGGYVSAAGKLVPFSSRGPMADGRIKPDITAPGLTIATSVSSYDTSYTETGTNKDLVISAFTHPVTSKKYYFAEFSGTSASAPAASGIVALMLQANPHLTPADIHDIIAATAIKDSYTGNLPAGGNNNWGNGKINAYGAVKRAIEKLGLSTTSGKKLDCVLFPNPGNGAFTLDFTGNRQETLRIEVLSIDGRLLQADSWTVQAGHNQRPLNLSQLAKGNYIVKLASNEGTISIKTVVQ